MVWVVVDEDKRERIFNSIPIRSNNYDEESSILGNPFGDFNYKSKKLEWLVNDYPGDAITLPRGSIKKLIGRELTWDDDPVELK